MNLAPDFSLDDNRGMAPSSRTVRTLERLLYPLFLAWAAFLFLHYFSWDKAFDLSFLRVPFRDLDRVEGAKFLANSLGSLRVLALSLAILFTLWRWGRKAYGALGLPPGNILLRSSTEMALGLLLSVSLWLGLGLNGLWYEGPVLGFSSAAFLWALWDFRANFMRFQRLPRWEGLDPWTLSLAAAGWAFLALSLSQCLLPELYFDGLVYHLAVLQFWIDHHGLADLFTNLYAHYPFGAELYFFNGYFLQGSESAKALNTAASAFCALAAAGWALERGGGLSAALAWTMVLSFPWISAVVWTTQNDLLLGWFLLLFFHALSRWAESKDKGAYPWALAAGLFGGGALAVKYTAVLGLGAGILGFVLVQGRDLLTRKAKEALCLLAPLLVVPLPWFLKNWAYAGDPVYPYWAGFWGGRSLSPASLAALLNDHEAVGILGFSFWDWLHRVLLADLDRTIAPLLFAFLPLALLLGPRVKLQARLLVLAGAFCLSGFLLSHQLRLMIPEFLVCFLLFSLVLTGPKQRKWGWTGAGIVLLFGLLSFLSLLRLAVNYYHGDQVWMGKQTREQYRAFPPQTSSYMDLAEACGTLPPGSRILIAGDARSLYYPRPFYANSVFDDQVLQVFAKEERDGEGIQKRFDQMGLDYLVVSGNEGARLAAQYPSFYDLTGAEWEKLDQWIRGHGSLVYQRGPNGIYRVHRERALGREAGPNLLEGIRRAKSAHPS